MENNTTGCTEYHSLYFLLPLPIPSKKNNKSAHIVRSRTTGKYVNMVHLSKRWKDYEESAIFDLKLQLREQIDHADMWEHYGEERILLAVIPYYANKRFADTPNIMDGVCDLIQDAGIISKDSHFSTHYIDRISPGDIPGHDSGYLEIFLYPLSLYTQKLVVELKEQ